MVLKLFNSDEIDYVFARYLLLDILNDILVCLLLVFCYFVADLILLFYCFEFLCLIIYFSITWCIMFVVWCLYFVVYAFTFDNVWLVYWFLGLFVVCLWICLRFMLVLNVCLLFCWFCVFGCYLCLLTVFCFVCVLFVFCFRNCGFFVYCVYLYNVVCVWCLLWVMLFCWLVIGDCCLICCVDWLGWIVCWFAALLLIVGYLDVFSILFYWFDLILLWFYLEFDYCCFDFAFREDCLRYLVCFKLGLLVF